MKCPCKDCQARRFMCHGRCEAYQEWCRKRELVLSALREEKNSLPDIDMVQMRKHWRRIRFGRRRHEK